MTQYIDKAAVLAEIKSLRCTTFSNFDEGVNCAATTLLESIDTLEVKEVDLEKELIDWWNTHYSERGYTFERHGGHYLENSTVIDIAKYFFELGLKKQKDNKL